MRIGIDLGGTKIAGVALDGDGAEIARRRAPTPRGDYPATLRAIAGLVAAIESDTGRRGSVGVGIPGAESLATGRVKNANSVWLIGQPLAEMTWLRRSDGRCGSPTMPTASRLSEAVDGAAAGAGVVFGVILGTGVGGGIVVGGRVLAGVNAVAGEWGHNPLPWPGDGERPGPSCYCGLEGCIETFLSGPGLVRDYAAGGGGTESRPAEIAALADRGDAPAVAALERYADRLARALATVINTLDPDVIVARRRRVEHRGAVRRRSGPLERPCVLGQGRYPARPRQVRRCQRRARRRLAMAHASRRLAGGPAPRSGSRGFEHP